MQACQLSAIAAARPRPVDDLALFQFCEGLAQAWQARHPIGDLRTIASPWERLTWRLGLNETAFFERGLAIRPKLEAQDLAWIQQQVLANQHRWRLAEGVSEPMTAE